MNNGADDFDEATTYYSYLSTEQRREGAYLIDVLQLEEGSKVLDLGCGTGYLTKLLASKVGPKGKILGVDPNLKRLQVAKEKHSAPNVVYQEGRAEDVPGTDYDVVFANFVLHWCEDKDKVFKQVAKSLKKGGKFGYVCNFDARKFDCPTIDFLTEEGQQIVQSKFHVPSSDALCSLALDNGFKTV